MGKERDVIIVGGGPVGLGLAIDLALKDVTSLVLERSESLHRIPKGQNLTQRSGEHFRAWGITEAVRMATLVPPEFGNAGIVIYGQLLGEYHYDWFQRSAVRPYYFADNERLPQYALEGVIRERVEDFPGIDFVTGAEAVGLEQDGQGVTVAYETASGKKTARAAYLAGCDGARSTIREAAGIGSEVDHEGPLMALLVFRSKELHGLLERYPGKSIFNVMNPELDGYWQFLGRVDLGGGWFYHAPVPAGTTRENYDFKAHLHRMAGAEFDIVFEHIGFWDLRISAAETYRAGRVFIAGDACHSHPPYGGYGVNTGLEDARNLSWKLAAELKGWAGPGLLDSYTAERHPVFKSLSCDFIGRMIEDFRGFLSEYSPDKDKKAFDSAWEARATADDSDVTEFLPNYAGSPLVFGEQGAVSSSKGTHCFEARPGYHLAPRPLPGGGDLWDALGPGFTLLDFSGDTGRTAAFEAAAASRGIPFRAVEHKDANLAKAYDTEAVLVRPDQFVAWVEGGYREDAEEVLARTVGG